MVIVQAVIINRTSSGVDASYYVTRVWAIVVIRALYVTLSVRRRLYFLRYLYGASDREIKNLEYVTVGYTRFTYPKLFISWPNAP